MFERLNLLNTSLRMYVIPKKHVFIQEILKRMIKKISRKVMNTRLFDGKLVQ